MRPDARHRSAIGRRSRQQVRHRSFFRNDLIALREVAHASPQQRAWIKRCVDVSISSVLLFFALPLMVVIAWFVRRDGGPVFYAWTRLGRGGGSTSLPSSFELWLRTPTECCATCWSGTRSRAENGRLASSSGMIRASQPLDSKLSFDEVPQLISVVKGDMSLVGPRSILPAERAAYGKAFDLYCQCATGFDGTVAGEWPQRPRLPASHRAQRLVSALILVDTIILFRTLPMVVRRIGAV